METCPECGVDALVFIKRFMIDGVYELIDCENCDYVVELS